MQGVVFCRENVFISNEEVFNSKEMNSFPNKIQYICLYTNRCHVVVSKKNCKFKEQAPPVRVGVGTRLEKFDFMVAN